MTTGAFSFWCISILVKLEFGDRDDVVVITLVKKILEIFEFGDFEAGEISLVVCVLVILTGTLATNTQNLFRLAKNHHQDSLVLLYTMSPGLCLLFSDGWRHQDTWF